MPLSIKSAWHLMSFKELPAQAPLSPTRLATQCPTNLCRHCSRPKVLQKYGPVFTFFFQTIKTCTLAQFFSSFSRQKIIQIPYMALKKDSGNLAVRLL
jgi:hypothetical protein